ncbi:MAG: hypothetical protein PHR06_01105 [Candidatus Cloacimonetes bacterium]|nr:hypothetical protein [Candidatus Cloacimonadota bacterium]
MALSEELQLILNSIKTILNSLTITDAFLTDVLKRLESLGYTATDADTWVISFSVQKVENNVKNSCNTTSIPDGLMKAAVDMVCGEFLFTKKGTGKLTGFDISTAVKQIQGGDTSVTFAINEGTRTPEQRLDLLITYLMNKGRDEFVSFRCIKW